MHDPFTREAYSRDPRNVARKAENYLTSTGIADTAYFGAEAEFYIFDSVAFDSKINGTFYEVDSESGWWNTGEPFEADGSPNRGYKVRPKGGYFPVAPVRPLRRPARRDGHQPDQRRLRARAGPPRGGHRRAGRDQLQVQHACCTRPTTCCCSNTSSRTPRGRTARPSRSCPSRCSVTTAPGMHVPPVAVEGRRAAVPRRVGLCRPVGHRAPLHRRHPAPRAVAAGVHQPDGELLQAAGARLRGSDQPGVQPAQPVGVRADPDHRQQPEGQAPGVPLPRQLGQPVPGVRGDADGRHRRHQEEDRAAGARSTRTSTSCRPTRPPTSRRRRPRCRR